MANAPSYLFNNSSTLPRADAAGFAYGPNLVDGSVGDTSTSYSNGSSANGYGYVVWDLGSPVSIAALKTVFGSTDSDGVEAYSCTVYACNDGVNWGSSIATNAGGSGGVMTAEDITFSPVTARFVLAQYTTNNLLSISDARIFNSVPAEVDSAITGTPLADSAPGVPAAPTGETITATEVTLTAPTTLPAGASSYSYQIAPAPGGTPGTYTTKEAGIAASGSIDVTGLFPGTEYAGRFVAVGAHGSTDGADDTWWTLPSAPSALFPVVISDSEIDIEIPALAGGATSYNLQQAPDSDGSPGSWSTIQSGVTVSANYQVTGLDAATPYWFRLEAVNGDSETADGAAATATTDGSTVGTVSCASTPAGPVVSWSAVPGAVTYIVKRSAHGADSFSNKQTGITGLSYTDTTAVVGTLYDYEVESVNGEGTSTASGIVTGTKLLTTSDLIFSTGIMTWYPITAVQPAITLSGSPLAAIRVNNSGSGVTGTAANMVDGDAGTSGTINSHAADVDTETSTDYVEVDLSAPFAVESVSLDITGGTLQTVNVWSADAQGLYPGQGGTTLLGSFTASVATHTVTPSLVTPGRYLLIESVYASAETLTIAEITAQVYPGIVMAFVQDLAFKEAFKRQEAFEAAIVNVAALDCQDAERKTTLSATNMDVQVFGLQLLLAAALASRNGATVSELSSTVTVQFPKMSLNYHQLTVDGRSVDYTFHGVKPKGTDLELKRDNYTMQKIELDCYENSQGKLWSILVDD